MTLAVSQFDHLIGTLTPDDLEIVGGCGATLRTADGKELLDCVGGQGVSAVGHGNTSIAKAVVAAWDGFAFTTAKYPHPIRSEFLSKLATKMPVSVDQFFLSNSGTEANEAALKFARLATGRTQLLAAKRAFHGRTMGALSVTFKPDFRAPFEPLVPDCDFFAYDKVESLAEKISDKTAAVILEVIQGEGGVYVGSQEFFDGVRKVCDQHGALLIIDEVQTGIARTGKFLALEHFGIRPDIITLAKALGGGYPIGVTAVRRDLFKAPPRGLHNTTFGGSVPACAAGLAVLNFIEQEKLIDAAAQKGAWLMNALRAIQSPRIKEVRGLGLMIGIEFTEPIGTIVQQLKTAGILVLPTGPKTIRLLPPLVITEEELKRVITTLKTIVA